MNNIIEYFYKIKPQNITQTGTNYYFKYNNESYYFEPYNYNEDISQTIKIFDNIPTLKPLINEIILNKDKEYITMVDSIPYYLYKVNINENIELTLSDIGYLSITNINNAQIKTINNWNELWEKRIDYLERQINEMGKKYPLLVESFNYYAGLTEVAIAYIKNTIIEEKPTTFDAPVLSHRHFTNQLYIKELYNPTNIILDHKTRDISEYLKKSYLKGNKNVCQEINEYFKIHYFSNYGIRLLIGRLLYPSYYFEIYDKIFTNQEPEKKIINIISKTDEYEQFLKKIYQSFQKKYHIPEIEFLNKKSH